jgi:tRNA pseudouridine13 synthase
MDPNDSPINNEPEDSQILRPNLPFLTADLPGIGGKIKTIPADFVVDEIPLYELAGTGTHVCAYIQKKGMTTAELVTRLGQLLGVRKFDIGYAGRKDANAITRQWVSIEHIDPEKLETMDLPGIKVLELTRHKNKLKIGHLKGNRFTIRLRNLASPLKEAEQQAKAIMDVLCRRGVPNYFGQQRFGYRNDSHLLGEAIIKNDIPQFFDIFLGRPELDSDPDFIKARQLYERGDLEAAFYAWHPAFRDHRRALKTLIKNKGNQNKTFRNMDARLLGLLVCAWQSDLFNAVLAERLSLVDTLLKGDMAYKHDNRACFHVDDPATEQPRCDAFAISPTGPLLGKRMTPVTDAAGAIENPILAGSIELTEEHCTRLRRFGAGGGRRPLRFQPQQADITSGTDELGEYLQLRFELPSGCYATVLLREITKLDE